MTIQFNKLLKVTVLGFAMAFTTGFAVETYAYPVVVRVYEGPAPYYGGGARYYRYTAPNPGYYYGWHHGYRYRYYYGPYHHDRYYYRHW